MCGGGGSTTNVTETGLGDEQYDALVENQGFIRDDISAASEAGQARFDSVDSQLDAGFDATQDRFDTVDESLSGISGDMTTGFADVLSGQETLASDVDTRLTQTDENISTGFTNLGNQFDTGVETINTNVDARAGELSDTLDTRFDTVDDTLETEFGGLDTRLDEDFSNVMTGQQEGFDAVGEQLTGTQEALSSQLTDTQGNILDATTVIKDLVDKYGGDASLYYEALAQGQSDLAQGQGTMQDAFDSFRTDYDDNVTLANQARADLASTVTGGFETMAETLGNQAQAIGDVGTAVSGVGQGVADVGADVISGAEATATNFGNVARDLAGLSGDVEGVAGDVEGVSGQVADFEDDTQANFGTVATDIASGAQANSAQAQANRDAFREKLNDVRDILQDENVTLDASVASVYTNLSNSFDETGNLITQSVTDEGTTITRALSEQGELFIAEFNSAGERLDQQTLDINTLLSNVDTFESSVQMQFTDIFGDATKAAESRGLIVDAFVTTNDLISQLGSNVSTDLADNFTALTNAFDASGSLIRDDIDSVGNRVTRELDAAGNLITTSIDANGNVINESITDIGALSTQLNTLQTGLGDTILTAFDGIQESGDELKANLIGNLNGLKNIMQTQGGNLSEQLTDKFTSLAASFDENGDLIRSAVDENGDFIFREINRKGELVISTVDDATGRLIESDKFNAKLLTEDLDSKFSSTEEFLQAIDRSMTEFGDDFQQGLLGMASGIDEGFASRFDTLEAGQKESQDLFKNRLTQVKALLEEDVADLDVGLRNRMTALSNAFDGEGRLIANAIDANGNLLQRQIDEQGNLILSTFSRLNGRMLDQQALSIDRLMNEIGQRSFTVGSNANMGGRSPTQGAPAPASVYSGFASPYAQTF